MTTPSRAYEALLDNLLTMHKGRVNNVHAGTHHDARRRRNLFSGCSCGWAASQRIEDDYDATVPTPCPTVQMIVAFRAAASGDLDDNLMTDTSNALGASECGRRLSTKCPSCGFSEGTCRRLSRHNPVGCCDDCTCHERTSGRTPAPTSASDDYQKGK